MARELLAGIDALHAEILAPIAGGQSRALFDALQVLLGQLERRSGQRRAAEVLGALTDGSEY